MSVAPSSTRIAPIALWRVAEAFLAKLYALFGAPEEVAARHTLMRQTHAQMLSWIRCAEALLRRLLLIEAAAYAASAPPPVRKPARPRARKLIGFDAEHPEAWRVSFRCMAPAPRQGDAESGAADSECVSLSPSKAERPGARFRSAWPLAERYEALIRVFNAPDAYARRLARRLHAGPARLAEPLQAPPEAVDRVDRFEELGAVARAAWRPYFNSG